MRVLVALPDGGHPLRFTFDDGTYSSSAARAAALTYGLPVGAGWKLMRNGRSLAMILGLSDAGAQDGDEFLLESL
jgi:hypothetical protein